MQHSQNPGSSVHQKSPSDRLLPSQNNTLVTDLNPSQPRQGDAKFRNPQWWKSKKKPASVNQSPKIVHCWKMAYGELKFEHKLGKGAYGQVFKGIYRKGQVAIKIYNFEANFTLKEKKSLFREIRLMQSLHSEYLAGLRGVCLKLRYCLAMEYCAGGSLRARLNQTTEAITLTEQMRWAMQISYGLYQLHRVNIVHRDLKSSNILLDSLNHAKVSDFGLSLVKSLSTLQTDIYYPWMAPQLFHHQTHSKKTDMYSLGMILWEIISRKEPSPAQKKTAMVSMGISGTRETLPENCPELFRLMITACWNAHPKKRPTAGYVGDQFRAALKSLETVPAMVNSASDAEIKKPPAKIEQPELKKK